MIRPVAQQDIDAVLTIWLAASIQAHDFISAEFWHSQVPAMRDQYLPASETYVLEEAGEILGFFSLHEETLAALFVAPAMQGKGYGRRLLAHAQTLRPRLNLTVYKANRRSVDFYRQCDFQIEREQSDQHTGEPELFMLWCSPA